MGWTVEIGSIGGALSSYPYADFGFVSRLNAVGFGHCVLAGLDGNTEPARGDAIRFVWDKGGSNEQVHFEGIVIDNERTEGPLRRLSIRDIPGYYGWISRTAEVRHFEDATPHTIIQAAGTPANILKRSDGTQVLTYGTSAAVPNKVDATNPGVRLDDFVADATRLILNWQRLCLQSRYGTAATPDGSYGLEFFGRFEGANNSSPRFYLVKRRLQSPSPGETFAVPDDAFRAMRGQEGATAQEVLQVVGGGHGASRVESGVVGSGGLEGVSQDKAIINATNATNMARRLEDLLDPANESAQIWSHKHTFSSRVGDTVTLAQDGHASKSLRIFETGYSLRERVFIHQLGRPRALERDPFYMLESVQGGHGTVAQLRSSASNGTAINSDGALADGATFPLAVSFFTAYNSKLHDGISVFAELASDIQVDFDLRVRLANASTGVDYVLERITPQETITDGSGRSIYRHHYWFDAALLASVGGDLDDILSCTIQFTNRDGTGASADVTGTARVSLAGA